ncbi:hypothetical protein V2J09_001218 [Rumex salicifolius]
MESETGQQIDYYVAEEETIKFITSWIRILNLSMEYFDTSIVIQIGNKLGRVLKIDKTISTAERGRYTRMSVEIDVTKPLLSNFYMNGKIWKIQYEGLRMVCFDCGKIGHQSGHCVTSVEDKMIHKPNVSQDAHSELYEDWGYWMLATHTFRDQSLKKQGTNENAGARVAKNQSQASGNSPTGTKLLGGISVEGPQYANGIIIDNKDKSSGSRFSVLAMDPDVLNLKSEVKNNSQIMEVNSKKTTGKEL